MADSETTLLEQFVRTRDAFAFRELVEQHQDMVFAACHRVLGNRSDAEDASQNCFLKFSQAAGRLRSPIAGWLHTVAVQGSIDILRGRIARRKREHAVAVQADQVSSGDVPWDDVLGEVDSAIAALPERLRTPIVLHFLERRTQTDVAAELGITRQSVAKRLRRGVEALQRRLKRAGVVAPAVALTAMLTANTAEAAPAALAATLGKVALSGAAGAKVAATGGTLLTLKTAVALVAAAGAGAGAVLIHQAVKPPHPAPLAATPVLKKAPLTPDAVLNAKLTLPPGGIALGELAKLINEQTGAVLACHMREAKRFLGLEPGRHTLRDVLATITASKPLTTEVVVDRGRVVVCVWQKPDAQILAQVMKLAASADVLERCTGARWLEVAGGRDALVQLLKMLGDPNMRVRYFASQSIVDGWAGPLAGDTALSALNRTSNLVSSIVPKGTGLVLAKAIETGTWKRTQSNMFRIAVHLRAPSVLPILKKQLEELTGDGGKKAKETFLAGYSTCQILSEFGGPEAETILLATAEQWPEPIPRWVRYSVGKLGSDRAVAWLNNLVDADVMDGKEERLVGISYALGASKNPAAVPVLIRIHNLARPQDRQISLASARMLAKFDTPEARAACLAAFKAEPDVEDRSKLAESMLNIPAVRQILFDELAQGGAVACNAALALAPTKDPRLVPVLVDALNTGDKRTAMYTLGRIGSPEAAQALIALVKSKDRDCRWALYDLGSTSAPTARKFLRASLQERNHLVRQWAADALRRRPDPADMDALLKCAHTGGGMMMEVRSHVELTAIWRAVAAIGGERAAKELLAILAQGSTPAARALMSSRDPHCIKAACDVLTGDDAKLRSRLMKGVDTFVSRYPSLSAFYAVEPALAELPGADPRDPKRKERRAFLLGWTHDPRGTEALGKLLVDANEPPAVRLMAIRGLIYVGLGGRRAADPAAVAPIRHAYEHDTSKEVKMWAKGTLEEWGVIPRDRVGRPAPPDALPGEREFPPPPPLPDA